MAISVPGIPQEARLSIGGGDTDHLYLSPRIGSDHLKNLLVHNMDMLKVVTKRPTPKVVTKQTDKDFLAVLYVVGESTSSALVSS